MNHMTQSWKDLSDACSDRIRDAAAPHSKLACELAAITGTPIDVACRLLSALGVDRHIDEATVALGRPPTVTDIVIGYRLSSSPVAGEMTR